MQAVAELALLEVADEAIDPRDRFGRRGRCIEAKKKGLVGRDTPECLPEVFSSPS